MGEVPLNCTERDPFLTHSPRFNKQARTHGYPIFAAYTAFEHLHSTHPHVVTHTRLQHGAFERDTPQPPSIVTLPSLQPLPPRARSTPSHARSAPLLRSSLRSENKPVSSKFQQKNSLTYMRNVGGWLACRCRHTFMRPQATIDNVVLGCWFRVQI